MTITFNGALLAVSAATLADLLALRLDDAGRHGIAIAVNGDVVPRGDWPRWLLADGDVVEVVTAVSGG